jgi:hypothetical protein
LAVTFLYSYCKQDLAINLCTSSNLFLLSSLFLSSGFLLLLSMFLLSNRVRNHTKTLRSHCRWCEYLSIVLGLYGYHYTALGVSLLTESRVVLAEHVKGAHLMNVSKGFKSVRGSRSTYHAQAQDHRAPKADVV